MSLHPSVKSKEAQDTEPILTLFSANLSAFKELADLSATRDGFVPSFRYEVQRFFLWGQGVSATGDQLDRALIHSQELRSHALLILRHLGIAISCCLSLCPDRPESLPSHEHLRSVLDASGTLPRQSSPQGSPSRHTHSVSDASKADLGRHLGEISAYINCLLDLSPALEHPVSDDQLRSFDQRLLARNQAFDASAGSSSIERSTAYDLASSANPTKRRYDRGKETSIAQRASIELSPTPDIQPVEGPVPGPAGHGEQNDPWEHKSVLSFDGGGVRNYWSLLALQALMREAAVHEKRLDESSRSSFDPCHTPESLSQLSPDSFTPYLPCHYFDYIAGTSTGGLIAILLSQFRMTAEDCMQDFKYIIGQMFGNPRIPFTAGPKYATTAPFNAIRTFNGRRSGDNTWLTDPFHTHFRTELDACRGLVLTTENAEIPVKIRSYSPSPPASSQSPSITARVRSKHYTLSVIQAVQAATAIPRYFPEFRIELQREVPRNMTRPPPGNRPVELTEDELENSSAPVSSVTLVDAGIGQYNNPCAELIREVEELHDSPVMTVVSIGTSRSELTSEPSSLTQSSRLAFEPRGDPEAVHESVKIQAASSPRWNYVRLDSPGGLGLTMDQWEPRKTGDRTLREIRNAFTAWIDADDHLEQIQRCAHQLVTLRRKRSSGDEDKWRRFALGQYYVCLDNECEGEEHRFRMRAEFESHLTKDHNLSGQELERRIQEGTRTWTYPKA